MDDKCDVFDEGTKLKRTFELIADGYIQFDKKGQGAIKKSDLREIVYRKIVQIKNNKRREGVDPVNEFLTKERFHELDTRAGELVTFREFLFAFESWVGMDDEEGKEEEENDKKRTKEEEEEEEGEKKEENDGLEETKIEKIIIPTEQFENAKEKELSTKTTTKNPFIFPTNAQKPKSAMKRNSSRHLATGKNGLKTLKELNDIDNLNKIPSSSGLPSQTSLMVSAEASKTSPGSVVLNNME